MSDFGFPEPGPDRFSIEPHGDGDALYFARDAARHGFNLGQISEIWPNTLEILNAPLERVETLEATITSQKQEVERLRDINAELERAIDSALLELGDETIGGLKVAAMKLQAAKDQLGQNTRLQDLYDMIEEHGKSNSELRSTVSVLDGRLKLAEGDRELQSKLLQFTQAMAEISFGGGTADGWDIQSKLETLGLITEVTMSAPCSSDHCTCAEVTDFPTECYRFTPEYLAAREAMQTAQQDGEGSE